MSEEKQMAQGRSSAKFLGSLRDALAAAGREDAPSTPAPAPVASEAKPTRREAAPPPVPSAAAAVQEARGGAPNVPPIDRHVEFERPPTTRVVRGAARPAAEVADAASDSPKTQVARGRQVIKRGQFHQDPVVGWLVIVGGPGLGAYRPIYEGNNTVGRSSSQRIPIDFGDDTISSEEQAYIRYDSEDRSFLFVPNLAKTNVVSINRKRPTSAVTLAAMDVIMMGRTELVFVPFCGTDFDWSELPDTKA